MTASTDPQEASCDREQERLMRLSDEEIRTELYAELRAAGVEDPESYRRELKEQLLKRFPILRRTPGNGA